MSNVFDAWLAGRTVRKHTMHVQRRENTAEHTWGVLMLMHKYVPYARMGLARYITTHDSGEAATCDIPAHVCLQMPELKAAVEAKEREHVRAVTNHPYDSSDFDLELTPDEYLVAEVLDRAEFVLSCWYEYQLGNQLAAKPIQRALRMMSTAIQQLGDEKMLQSMRYLNNDVHQLVQPQGSVAA